MTNRPEKPSSPVTREVLSDGVRDRILTWIIEGEVEPGARIVETRVARELGVSQAPVREALRDLAILGFVEMEPHKGARVRNPTRQELIDAIEVRAELEALGGRLAAVRRTEQCLGDLEAIYTAMVDAAARGDARDQALTNTRFHAKVIAAAHNPILQRQWSMLEPFSRTYVTAVAPGADLLWLSQRHEQILSAIRDQDPELAARLSRTHATEAVAVLEGLDDAGDGVTADEGPP